VEKHVTTLIISVCNPKIAKGEGSYYCNLSYYLWIILRVIILMKINKKGVQGRSHQTNHNIVK
jgi:hypothetical protein